MKKIHDRDTEGIFSAPLRGAFLCLFALCVSVVISSAGVAAEPVDLELILAIDISGSIDPDEAKLQRDGYVNAFTHPQVIGAVTSGITGRIAVAYFEWASARDQRLVADWRLIDGAAAAHRFSAELAAMPIATGQRTSISGAIAYALPMFGRGYQGTRRVLDISGDGPNNDGLLITAARDRALSEGVVINGLAIISDRPNRWGFPTSPDLDQYYEGCVIGGPGSFAIVAENFESFGDAVRRKLILEIAARPAPLRRHARRALRPPSLLQRADYAPGCDIGERQSREYFQRRFGD